MTPPWLAGARRIAVVRFDRLGDVTLTLPMFQALREQVPAATLHLACLPYTAPVVQGAPCVDQVHALPGADAVDALEALFRREQFDVVFFPLHDPRHPWVAWKAGIPHRVGTGRKALSFLYNHWVFARRSWKSGRHAAVLNVEMVAAMVGAPLETRLVALPVAPEAAGALRAKLTALQVPPATPLLVVHPGSFGSAPEWPPGGFAAAARALAREAGCMVMVTGVAAEEALVRRVVRECEGAVPLAGLLSLAELVALIAQARLVLTNCTGPLHLAAACDTPVVGVLTGADVPRWRPLNPRGGWVASPPGVRDLQGVTVEQVVDEARRVLAFPPRA